MYNGIDIAAEDNPDIVSIPGGTWLVYVIPKKYQDDVGSFIIRCLTEYIPALGYELNSVDVEYFTDEKWEAWFFVRDKEDDVAAKYAKCNDNVQPISYNYRSNHPLLK